MSIYEKTDEELNYTSGYSFYSFWIEYRTRLSICSLTLFLGIVSKDVKYKEVFISMKQIRTQWNTAHTTQIIYLLCK